MLKFDYVIRRNNGVEIEEYRPKSYSTTLDNLTVIAGPNSSGKSTILNLVALGFYGRESSKVSPALKTRMNALLDRPRTLLTFAVEITAEGGALKLSAAKPSFNSDQIDVWEERAGKRLRLAEESFATRYNLIYDIPTDPLLRLRELIRGFAEKQRTIRHRALGLRDMIRLVLENIRDARDPGRIAALEKELSKIKDADSTISRKFAILNARSKTLERYLAARLLAQALVEFATIDQTIRLQSASRKKFVKRLKQADEAQESARLRVQVGLDRVEAMRSSIAKVARQTLPKAKQHLVRAWEQINIGGSLDDGALPTTLTRLATTLRHELSACVSEPTRERQRQAEFYHKLADFLEQFKAMEVRLPESELGPKQLISALRKEADKSRAATELAQAIDSAIKEIDDLLVDASTLTPELHSLKAERVARPTTDTTTEDEVPDDSMDRLEGKRRELETRVDGLRVAAAKQDVLDDDLETVIRELEREPELARFASQGDRQVELARDELVGMVRDLSLDHDQKSADIAFRERELERLKSRKPHKHQNDQKKLERLLEASTLLQERVQKEFEPFAQDLSREPPTPPKSELEKRYYDAMGRFLGRLLGTVRHVDRFHGVQMIDFARQSIVTTEGRQLSFHDFGTGQGQSAYLLGLLTPSDSRKIIALFDEVAMMDDESLAPIHARMIKLRESGQLLAGVVVEAARTPSTRALSR